MDNVPRWNDDAMKGKIESILKQVIKMLEFALDGIESPVAVAEVTALAASKLGTVSLLSSTSVAVNIKNKGISPELILAGEQEGWRVRDLLEELVKMDVELNKDES